MLNLVLTGFMGTGKSTIGRKLARRLGLKFVDTDQEIENVSGLTIHQIFKQDGEIRFRSEEKAAVKRVTRNGNQVISTGGGVVLDSENMDALRQNGIIICLTASPDIIYQRVKGKKNRPLLLKGDLMETILKLLAERKPYYENADSIVDTSEKEADAVVDEIVGLFNQLSRKKAQQ